MKRVRPYLSFLACSFVAGVSSLAVDAGADPCADGLAEFQVGADGGYHPEIRPLPDVVLGLPRGGGEQTQSLDVLSLGDGGSITLSFLDNAIVDGPGDDFRVFENAFRTSATSIFREVGMVEASLDGGTFFRFPFEAGSLDGLAGQTPVLTHPENGIDPRHPDAGGDGFDLASIGLAEARFIRIVDAGDQVDDEGNHFPIRGRGQSGFDLDAIVAVHSRETCGSCCDTVYDNRLGADDLITLLREIDGLSTQRVCGPTPCSAASCGDTDRDSDIDLDDAWLCLERALGEDIPCQASACDMATPTPDIERASSVLHALEIPGPATIQSGIGIVSGWKCEGGTLTARFDDGAALAVAYGTPRGDTLEICGDQDNAFILQWNYANLDDGEHVVRLYDDGVEFASSTFSVQTLGRRFLLPEHTPGQTDFWLSDFPDPETANAVQVRWHSAAQSFGIVELTVGYGEGVTERPSASASGNLEIPQAGSTMSGIGIVSGWRCEGGEITASFDGGNPLPVAYGTPRGDTASICGDTDNAYALQWNYGLLGDGPHDLTLFDDGMAFATVDFYVTTLGVPFLRGAVGRYELPDFPAAGDLTTVAWQQAGQNFGVVAFTPATMAPTPTPHPVASPISPEACATLRVRLAVDRDPLGALLADLVYPPSLSLPWNEGEDAVHARIEFLAQPRLFAARGRANKLALGLADADGITRGDFAEIQFDCLGPPATATDFSCTLDAADPEGNSTGADCEIEIEVEPVGREDGGG